MRGIGVHSVARMMSFLNRLTSNRSLAVLLLLFSMLPFALVATAEPPKPWWMWAPVALMLVIITGLIWDLRWAPRAAGGLLFCIAVSESVSGINSEWNWRKAGKVVGCSLIAYGVWRRPDEGFFEVFEDKADGNALNRRVAGRSSGSNMAEGEDEEPVISLVHLRSTVRYLEAAVLAEALSEAWSLRITSGDGSENSDGFVVGETPLFIVSVRSPVQAFFLIHNRDEKYFDEAEELAQKVPNLRFAQVIRQHEAWLSVDLMNLEGEVDQADKAYQLIGKAVAALTDDATLGIFCPQHRTFNLWSEDLADILSGNEPLSVFREEVKAPVIGVRNNDGIEAAIAEARNRWAEFYKAFQQRDRENEDAPPYLVKARFASGEEVEHMWIQVFGLEPEYVHGHLLNEPYHHPKLKRGVQVEVPLDDVSDWIFIRDNEPVGNFTGKVVADSSQSKES